MSIDRRGFLQRTGMAAAGLGAGLGAGDELIGQSVLRSYGFGDDGLRVLAPGEAAAFLSFQVSTADLGQGILTFRRGMASLFWALEDRLRGWKPVRPGCSRPHPETSCYRSRAVKMFYRVVAVAVVVTVIAVAFVPGVDDLVEQIFQ